tara:strand:- start:77521 stop:78054 length:534 start_codon:yes stop_codon:yes gene_type:complete
MKKADCFQLGYVAKLHGYKGEVSLFFDTTNPEYYRNLDAVFIDISGNLTPFFIDRIELGKKGFARVKFEGVDDEQSAKSILRKELYLPLKALPDLEGKHFYDHEVVGFSVIDAEKGNVGKLIEVVDYKTNPLLRIEATNGNEVLLPLLADLIQSVDRDKKELHVKSPEGLIELYLES